MYERHSTSTSALVGKNDEIIAGGVRRILPRSAGAGYLGVVSDPINKLYLIKKKK